jgi:hypothetical protein
LLARADEVLAQQLVALLSGHDTGTATIGRVFVTAYEAAFEQPIAQPSDR